MAARRNFVVHAGLSITPSTPESSSIAAVKAGILAALRADLQAEVRSLELFEVAHTESLATEASARSIRRAPPKPCVSNRDEIVDQYEHAGMEVRIYQAANSGPRPKYFGVVLIPRVKQPTGAVFQAKDDSSFDKTVEIAEQRAERKAELLARRERLNRPLAPATQL